MLQEKRVIEFKLISGTRAEYINQEVNKLIMQGWELYFGPTGDEYITQALVKYQTVRKGKRS